jgi:hypothetical protein
VELARLTRHRGEAAPTGLETTAAEAAEVVADVLGSRVESDVQFLKAVRHRSVVVRLRLRSENPRTVVAKLCHAETADREQLVYERVLPRLGVSAPQLLGARDAADGRTWLVLEDAGDLAWSARSPEHRALAAEWFGTAHLAAVGLGAEVPLPDRGPAYYREMLGEARSLSLEAVRNPALSFEEALVLRRFAGLCTSLETGWDTVDALLSSLPTTLTLPGFCRKNARVRPSAAGIELLPLDFENAGWGSPATELQHVDAVRYCAQVAPAWAVRPEDVVLAGVVGSALVSLKSVPGERSTLLGEWPERAARKIAYYAESLEGTLDALAGAGAP